MVCCPCAALNGLPLARVKRRPVVSPLPGAAPPALAVGLSAWSPVAQQQSRAEPALNTND